jgi:transglutaminase-like putative cysteine protease
MPTDLTAYLRPGPVVDCADTGITALAGVLRGGDDSVVAIAARCYRFVRDEIAHSGDMRSDVVTLKASEVLRAGTGWCFAKSHLLAALLRVNGIPAALCYQRLQKDGQGTYTLHGLNAVFLPEHGWYRCDARGNKPGVAAEFTPPEERLAWTADDTGEFNLSGRHAEPAAAVVDCLSRNRSFQQVYANLPDVSAVET